MWARGSSVATDCAQLHRTVFPCGKLTAERTGVPHKGARGGEGGHPAGAAATYLWRQANVRYATV